MNQASKSRTGGIRRWIRGKNIARRRQRWEILSLYATDFPMVLSVKKWLGSEGTSQRVVRDFVGLLLERGGRFAVGFVVTGIVARHLGTSSFGELSYGFAIGMIGAGIAQLGLDSLAMRNLARQTDEAARLSW